MPKTITILMPLFIVATSALLTRRECTLYLQAQREPSDFFPYTVQRLWRRLAGVAVLLSLGGTLAALGLVPPTDARQAARYEVLLLGGVLMLVLLSAWDLWAMGRPVRRRRPAAVASDLPSRVLH